MHKDHVSREEFLFDFFGMIGRELGDPMQHFSDNPNEVIPFIESSTRDKKPAFMSVQPRTAHYVVYGIEKIFFDFDYANKTFVKELGEQIEAGKLTQEEADQILKDRRTELEAEVRVFVNSLRRFPRMLIPLIVKTRKGYHFYFYFDRIYEIDDDIEHWRRVYRGLQDRLAMLIERYTYKYMDSAILGDIHRMARIPTSVHEASGEECQILDSDFKPTKMRSLNYYRGFGLRESDIITIHEMVKEQEKKEKAEAEQTQSEKRNDWESKGGFIGQIRPCFQVRIDLGEMPHQQRLALLVEAYYAGYDSIPKMMEFFRAFKDYDGERSNSTCRYQVEWFFKHKVDGNRHKCYTLPYKCDTIEGFGWCLKESCSRWQKGHKT
jgi:hypothetical protein